MSGGLAPWLTDLTEGRPGVHHPPAGEVREGHAVGLRRPPGRAVQVFILPSSEGRKWFHSEAANCRSDVGVMVTGGDPVPGGWWGCCHPAGALPTWGAHT